MIFETERLYAREWTLEDVEDLFAIYSDPEVQRYLGREPKVVASLDEMRIWIEARKERTKNFPPGQGAWGIFRKSDDRGIGTVLFKPIPDGDDNPTGDIEIGWHFGQAYWGNGYATEAAHGCLEYGFRMNPELKRVVAVFYPANTASERVMQRIGMTALGMSDKYYGTELMVYEINRPAGL